MTDLISAVIPTYNYGHFVVEAVESALAQTYEQLEIIVVDDGSTDDTRRRLEPYLSRIRYVHQQNQGLSAARNTGIRSAKGRWIAFLDSDDRWHPRKIEAQMRYVQAHPEVGLVAADSRSDPIADWWPIDAPEAIAGRTIRTNEILVRSRFGPGSVLARRECFNEVGCFDTGLRSAEDRDMWIRISARYPVVKLEAPLWWYRLHSASMSNAATRMEENEMRVLRRALENQDAVRRQFMLRRKVLAYTLKSASIRYAAADQPAKALNRLMRSMALWPIPFRKDERILPFERPRRIISNLMKLIKRTASRGHTNCPLKAQSATNSTAPHSHSTAAVVGNVI